MTDPPSDPAAPGTPPRARQGASRFLPPLAWLGATIAALAIGIGISLGIGFLLLVITRGSDPREFLWMYALASIPGLIGLLVAYFSGRRFVAACRTLGTQPILLLIGCVAGVAALVIGGGAWERATQMSRWTPQRVVGGLAFSTIAASEDATCALTREGVPYCWGEGYGRAPTRVASDLILVSLVSGRSRSCGLSATGATYCFGASQDRGANASALDLQQSDTLVLRSLSLGGLGLCGLSPQGIAYCEHGVGATTRYASGRCGTASPDGTCEDGSGPNDAEPAAGVGRGQFLAVGGDQRFDEIAVGARHICGRVKTGETRCWGYYRWQDANDESVVNLTRPHSELGVGMRFASTSAGTGSTCALTADGIAWCEGTFDAERFFAEMDATVALGVDTTAPPDAQRALVGGGLRFTQIVTRDFRACAISVDSAAYCWGSDEAFGVSGGRGYQPEPMLVAEGHRFESITLGASHTCGLDANGAAWCWGRNDRAQLGRRPWPW